METTIKWKKVFEKPPGEEFGWYPCLMAPENFREFKEKRDCNRWIESFGFKVLWFCDGKFFLDGENVTNCVLFYADKPTIDTEEFWKQYHDFFKSETE